MHELSHEGLLSECAEGHGLVRDAVMLSSSKLFAECLIGATCSAFVALFLMALFNTRIDVK